MATDSAITDLLPTLSDPLGKAGMNPDDAMRDIPGSIAKLLGPADATPQPNWYDPPADEEAQNAASQQLSPNGNALPGRLQSRVANPAPPAAATPTAAPATPPAPTGAVPASVTKTGDPALAGLAAANAADIQATQGAHLKQMADVDAMAAQPTEEEATARERAAQAAYAVPTNPKAVDPRTGKPLYKPSIAQRIARGAGAVYKGGVLGAVDPEIVGAKPYGAPNTDYDYDEAARQAREASATTQLKQAQDNWAAARDKFAAVTKARGEAVGAIKDPAAASVAQQDQPNKAIDSTARQTTAQADLMRAQDATLPKNEMEAIAAYNRETDPVKKAQLKATVDQMHQNALEEKPPRIPGDHPSAELQRYDDLVAAKRRENKGKPLSSDDYDQISAQLKGEGGIGDAEVGSIIAQAMDAKQKFADQWKRADDGSYVSTDESSAKTLTAKQFQDQIDKIGRTDPNTKLAKKGYKIDETGNIVQKAEDVPSAATPDAAKATAPAPAGKPVPAPNGTRRRTPKGTVEIKKNGQWVKESNGR